MLSCLDYYCIVVFIVFYIAYRVFNVPKLDEPLPNTNTTYAQLMENINQLQTGDIIFCRKRYQVGQTDRLLTHYFHGHCIMCLRMNNIVLGLDMVNKNNDCPNNKQHVIFINPYIRIFPLKIYVQDAVCLYNTEMTIYTLQRQ